MTSDRREASEDLAFMRSLVEAGNARNAMAGGAGFAAAGTVYGLQCLVQWAGVTGLIPMSQMGWLVSSFGPTLLLLAWGSWFLWRRRNLHQTRATRAINAAFTALGSTNLVILIVVGILATRKQSIEIWELYGSIVFALQGSGWLIAYLLRKQIWLLAVGLGWFASAIVSAYSIGTASYILICALSLFGLMALPGFVMMRLARAEE
jgi:hypothetical protein